MRVLLIDYRESLAGELQPALESAGFAVHVAPAAEQVDDLARSGLYDVLLLADPTPADGGRALLQRWRSEGMQLPVLVLSSGRPKDRLAYIEHGADDCQPLACAVTELRSRLQAVGRRADKQLGLLRVGDLVIDRARKSVRRGDRAIALTPHEFALLTLLALHRGEVLPRSVIREKLFGPHDSNIVDVYIRNLRQKVDKDFPLSLIRTQRGVGYFLAG